MSTPNKGLSPDRVKSAIQEACAKIAPLWPLENFVAVNPYLGLTGRTFDHAAQLLGQVGGINSTLPVAFYKKAIEQGRLTLGDIEHALGRKQTPFGRDVQAFMRHVDTVANEVSTGPAVDGFAEVADQCCGQDWSGFVTDRISSWASSYFDRGQAQWKAADVQSDIFNAWRFEAVADLTPRVMGLKGMRQIFRELPHNEEAAARMALETLSVPPAALDLYLHRLLRRHGGWAAYVAYLDWEDRLHGREPYRLRMFLSTLLCWEYGLYRGLQQNGLHEAWTSAKAGMLELAKTTEPDKDLWSHLVLQEAFDLASQRNLIKKLGAKAKGKMAKSEPAMVQAVFCIDVRSELYRRNLELVSSEVETLGFAGFFGFPIKYLPLGHDNAEDHCPVLLAPTYTVAEGFESKAVHAAELAQRKTDRLVSHAWKSFRTGAIASFGFVSPLGLAYLPKLFTDSFGLSRPVTHPGKNTSGKNPVQQAEVVLEVGPERKKMVGIPLEARIEMAKGALTAMSLTSNFARVVLLVGHGSTSVNNPHASGLDCGACAGHSGEANARVAASVLNDPEVRIYLREGGIYIPPTTHFMAALHDTTTDEVTLFNTDRVPHSHRSEVAVLQAMLRKASAGARAERALRMHMGTSGDVKSAIMMRSKDWSQVRPEWGLAGCSAFVAAPRNLSSGINLEGRTFLHSYEWKRDRGFRVLETIMTAPVVVASWINLQYYGSTVDNKRFGSGNKTLHNVTAGIGVLEGFAGDLRPGLPMQSVHDGINHQHEPLRLAVVVNAPREAINEILKKHPSVQALFDNGWIFLLALDDNGQVTHRYARSQQWEPVDGYTPASGPEETLARDYKGHEEVLA